MEERAIEALKKQFAEWGSNGKWHLAGLVTLSDEEDADDRWYDGDVPVEESLKRITSNPNSLAEEIHQIRYDSGITLASEFVIEYRHRLEGLGFTAKELNEVLDFIDQHSEHSH